MNTSSCDNYYRNLYDKYDHHIGFQEGESFEDVFEDEIEKHQKKFGILHFAAFLLVALEVKYAVTEDFELLNFVTLVELLEMAGMPPIITPKIMIAAKELESKDLIYVEFLPAKLIRNIDTVDRNVYDYYGIEEVNPEAEVSTITVSLTQKLINSLTF